jgi:thiamine biosynthesis lipoprotein
MPGWHGVVEGGSGLEVNLTNDTSCEAASRPTSSVRPVSFHAMLRGPDFALGLTFLLLVVSFSARGAQLTRYEYSLPRMGTIFHIELYAADDATASKAAEAAFARAEELEQIMSDYRQDSELMRLAREGARAPVPVSDDLYAVLAKSIRISELSHGAFDVTVGPLVALWREAHTTRRFPDSSDLLKAKALVDYRFIELDSRRHTVFLKRAGMKLDLGAIGKGYAADQMLALLQARGLRHSMVIAGGEVAVGAPPPGAAGWKVAINTADAIAGNAPCTLLLHDAAVSTSGDSEQFVEIHGKRYSHVIDPFTGVALVGLASTTVLARDATTTDALGTALSIMPVADAIQLAESLPGVAVYMVRDADNGWKRYSSRGFPESCLASISASPN